MGSGPSRFRVAAVQAAPVYMDREGTAEKACRLIEEAARNGADFVGFPECFIPGFPSWVYAASPIYDTIRIFEDYVRSSVEVPSSITDMLCEAARQNEIYVVMGISEKDVSSSSTLYITQLFIDKDGRIMGKHRKIVPTYAEKLLFTPGDGSTLSVFKTDYGELGGLNCGEHNNPLAKFALIAQNVKIHVASWPMPGAFLSLFREMIIPCVREYSYESKAFVINSSAVVTPEIRDALLEYARSVRHIYEADVRLGGGVGCVIAPMFGRIISQANADREEIIYADCDMAEYYAAKIIHDVLGNYNRPEIFSLTINKKNYRLVEIVESGLQEVLASIPAERRRKLNEMLASRGRDIEGFVKELIEQYISSN